MLFVELWFACALLFGYCGLVARLFWWVWICIYEVLVCVGC